MFFQLYHLANPIYIFITVSSYWFFFSQVCSYYYVFTFISPHNAPKKNLECLHLIFITNLQFFMCFLRASLFYFSIYPKYSLHCPQLNNYISAARVCFSACLLYEGCSQSTGTHFIYTYKIKLADRRNWPPNKPSLQGVECSVGINCLCTVNQPG